MYVCVCGGLQTAGGTCLPPSALGEGGGIPSDLVQVPLPAGTSHGLWTQDFFSFLFLAVYTNVPVWVCALEHSAHRDQRRCLIPVELVLQAVVNLTHLLCRSRLAPAR